MFRPATIASSRIARAVIYLFSHPVLSSNTTTFYDHALRWAPENLPGFLGKEPRHRSDFEDLLFD